MFIYLSMCALQYGIGRQILAVFESKGKCMSPTFCQLYFFKYIFVRLQSLPLPCYSSFTFPQGQTFLEVRRVFAVVLTF